MSNKKVDVHFKLDPDMPVDKCIIDLMKQNIIGSRGKKQFMCAAVLQKYGYTPASLQNTGKTPKPVVSEGLESESKLDQCDTKQPNEVQQSEMDYLKNIPADILDSFFE